MHAPISIDFTPTNKEMTQYNIELTIPFDYKEKEEMPPFLCDVAAIHFFIANEDNMDAIIEYFNDNVHKGLENE